MENLQTSQAERIPSKQDQILLYGPGMIGREILNFLRSNGYTVCGFLGRNAKQHPIVEGLPCWLPTEVPSEQRAEYLVIVSVFTWSPDEYKEIGQSLGKLGFLRVIHYSDCAHLPYRYFDHLEPEWVLKELQAERKRLRMKIESWRTENITVGDFTYFGDNKSIPWWGEGTLRIGKFCSIASNVTLMLGGGHRADWLTTFNFDFASFCVCKPFPDLKHDITIGNDVWIGNGVTIMPGVTIADGAVIGINALVTKDVGPYEIWGGVPAKLIRKRFPEETIRKMLDMRWWDWTDEEIVGAMPILMNSDIEALVEFYHKNHLSRQ